MLLLISSMKPNGSLAHGGIVWVNWPIQSLKSGSLSRQQREASGVQGARPPPPPLAGMEAAKSCKDALGALG
jgi:hypothetical protein